MVTFTWSRIVKCKQYPGCDMLRQRDCLFLPARRVCGTIQRHRLQCHEQLDRGWVRNLRRAQQKQAQILVISSCLKNIHHIRSVACKAQQCIRLDLQKYNSDSICGTNILTNSDITTNFCNWLGCEYSNCVWINFTKKSGHTIPYMWHESNFCEEFPI